MKNYFLGGILFLLPAMENSLPSFEEAPGRILFPSTGEIKLEGRKIAVSPVSGELVGYQGRTFFLRNEKNKTESLSFDSPFSSPLAWSNDGHYLLGGIDCYDTKTRQKVNRDWTGPLLAALPEKNETVATYWSIYNAQWDPAMRFLVAFSGYQGPLQNLSTALQTQYLHQLVMIDSSGKNTRLLAGFSDRDAITDIALEDTLLITAGKNICWWNLTRPQEQHYLKQNPGKNAQVTIQPNGKLGAVTDNAGRIITWNLADPDKATAIQGHEGEIYDALFHPLLPLLFTTGADHKLKCWWWKDGTLTEIPNDLPAGNDYALCGFDNQQQLVLTVYSGKEKKKCSYKISTGQ